MHPPSTRHEVDGEVERLLIAGQKITAIKLVRERTGKDLKEAKQHVEAVAKRMPPGTLPPPAQIGAVGWLALIALLLVGWLVYRSL